MEKTLQTLHRIKELAVKNDEYEKMIEHLKGQIENEPSPQKSKGRIPEYIILFVIFFIIMMFLFNKILSIILNMASGRFTFKLALKASSGNVNPIFGMILAIPAALIIVRIASKIFKFISRKKNPLNSEESQNSSIFNEPNTSNDKISTEDDIIIMNQIMVYEEMQKELVQKFQELAPWYPEVYFKLSTVNYIIEQLETEKANSVNQAIVHYEAGE